MITNSGGSYCPTVTANTHAQIIHSLEPPSVTLLYHTAPVAQLTSSQPARQHAGMHQHTSMGAVMQHQRQSMLGLLRLGCVLRGVWPGSVQAGHSWPQGCAYYDWILCTWDS